MLLVHNRDLKLSGTIAALADAEGQFTIRSDQPGGIPVGQVIINGRIRTILTERVGVDCIAGNIIAGEVRPGRRFARH